MMLILILFLPAFFAFQHLQLTTSDLLKKAELEKVDSLEYEMNEFAESLAPVNFIESALETTEVKLGLKSDLKSDEGEDPELYKRSVFEKMLSILQADYSLKPVLLVGIEHDMQKIHSFFAPDFANKSEEDKSALEVVLVEAVINTVMRRQVKKNVIVRERLKKALAENGLQAFTGSTFLEKNEDILKNAFSPVADFPKVPGTCNEIYTTSFGSQRLYFYLNGTMQGKHLYGGYFVVFASRNVSCSKIVSMAKKAGGIYHRGLVKSSLPIEQMLLASRKKTALIRHLPESFQSHYSQVSKKISFSDLNNYGLRVSVADAHLNGKIKWYFKFSSLMQKFLLLLAYGFSAFFYFNGFNVRGKLRKKILLISGLIILLPYILVGYFSGLILDSMEKIRPREVQTAAECKMFSVSQFIRDLALRRQLVVLDAKKKMSNIFLKNSDSVINPDFSNKLIPKTINDADVSVFLPDGRSRLLNSGQSGRPDGEKFARFMGFKCLNRMGVLQKENEKARREVELANLAAGFLSGIKRRYTEGLVLRFEATTAKDIAQMAIFWKMSYFILSTTIDGLQHAGGLGLIFFDDLHAFGDSFNRISYDFQNFLKEKNEFLSHSFAIGRIDGRGELWIRWPETITSKDKEKRLLEYVAKETFSGSETRKDGNKIQTLIWKYNLRQPYLFAGVTESTPDLWIIYMFNLLPFAGGAFSFLSLFLLADFLWELFVKPVKEFIPALEQISAGEYRTRIQIAKTDELGLLADSFNSMTEGLQQREKMHRFVSEKLIEAVAQADNSTGSRTTENELSVLISDIRGFTRLSEKHSPEEIVSLLNEYFTEMEDAIKSFGGSVERFIGDAVVAVFYPKPDGENHAQRSVNAAMAMRDKLQILNEKRQRQGKFVIENGVGIVTDVAISGVTGGKSGRQVFMVIGSALMRAGELDSLTAGFQGNRIAVCSKTAQMATNQVFVAVPGERDAMRPVEKND